MANAIVSRSLSVHKEHEVLLKLEAAGLDDDLAQAIIDSRGNELGRKMIEFARNGGKISAPEPVVITPPPPSTITIDRSTLFDPATFIGEGWSIWKGPADGDSLTGEEDQDQRSLALTELNSSEIMLVSTLQSRESSVHGEERLRRLKRADHIRLDAKIFQTYWENPGSIPEEFGKRDSKGNIRFIYFDGTILRAPDGHRCVLSLYLGDGGQWDWGCDWLGGVFDDQDLSASRASS